MKSLSVPVGFLFVTLGLAAISLSQTIPENDKGLFVEQGPERDSPVGDFYLLAIAIDDYLHWPELRSPVADAEAVTKALVGQYGFAPQNVVKLYDEEATEEGIMEALRRAATGLGADDSLLIYYSGHGQLDELTKTGAWIPQDARRDNESAWIHNSRIKAILGAMKARHVLVISDSCFAGDFFSGQKGAPPSLMLTYVRRSRRAAARNPWSLTVIMKISGRKWKSEASTTCWHFRRSPSSRTRTRREWPI